MSFGGGWVVVDFKWEVGRTHERGEGYAGAGGGWRLWLQLLLRWGPALLWWWWWHSIDRLVD